MSVNTIPTSVFSDWVSHVAKNPTIDNGIWIRGDAVLQPFCSYTKITKITTVSFKRRMNNTCSISNYIYKMDKYCNDQKKYIRYYLFLSKSNDESKTVKERYTIFRDSMPI